MKLFHKIADRGSHYKFFEIQPYEFIAKNDLSFFQGVMLLNMFVDINIKMELKI